MTLSIAILLPVLLAALWLARTAHLIGRVSSGPKIPDRQGTALLLIDLQTCFWTDALYDAATRKRVEATLSRAIDAARAAGQPVIALRQEWSLPSTRLLARLAMGGKALAGAPDTGLAAPFAGQADHEVVKRVQDGFETGALDKLLAELDIGQLTIAGLDGLYCVNKTAQAALNRGYGVTLLDEAIASTDPEKFTRIREGLAAKGACLA